MISCYFGVPGAGKTTLLTMFARQALKDIEFYNKYHFRRSRKRRVYEHIYTNFQCEGCERIEYLDLKTYKMYNSLILLDELTLDADNRDFKKFPIEIRDFLVLHRHLGVDIIYATQAYDKVDTKIRALTQDLWYMSKSVIPLLCEFTVAKRIYRNITINEYTSELLLGYRFCNFLEAFFVRNVRICFRRLYYSSFNSFDEDRLATREVFKSSLWGTESEVLPKPETISADPLPDDEFDIEFFNLDEG